MSKTIELTGKRFGRLVIIGRAENDGGGLSQSCGCMWREAIKSANTTHGQSRVGQETPEYEVWASMVQRCGGRGIAVCDRWRKFENFFADMGPRLSCRHSLDRINNDGNYEPGNCRWATRIEQANNTRGNRRVTFDGETLTLSQWAKRVGIAANTLRQRLDSDWPVERTLTEPVQS